MSDELRGRLADVLDREVIRLVLDEQSGDGPHWAECGSQNSTYEDHIPCDCGEPERRRALIKWTRKVIERHRPEPYKKAGGSWCTYCNEDMPCPDLLDAATAWGVTP